jgi:UDP-GlcNAc:undecaprenyl-phosphate/decaprenyl-phosphate GlcNAc-1-phosphate transferase
MKFSLLRYVTAFVAPFAATLLLTPVAGRVARRWALLDHPASHKAHARATPYLGGVAVAAGLVLVGSFAAGASGQLLTILLCAVAISAMGLVDDWRTVRPSVKLIVESAAATALWAAGIRAGLFGVPALDFVLTVAWVIVVTNAVNILDNMDGVASGVVALSATGLFAIAAGQGDYLVASMALAIAGACVGFLPHNYPPARIFLGDAGSLLLGFLLASLALKLDLVGASGLIRSSVAALIVAVPLFDMLLVVISRTLGGRPVYVGGTDHSAHRLSSLGWSGRRVAAALCAAQGILAGAAVWVTRLETVAIIPLISFAAASGFAVLLILLRTETRSPSGVPEAARPTTPELIVDTMPRS